MWAVHPKSGLVHRGKILTMEDNNIMVNFQTQELGVEKVPDFSLIAASERDPATDNARADQLDCDLEEGTQVLQGLDHFSMALLVMLLERKTHLVTEMRRFNDLAEKKQLQGLKGEFFEDLGWVGANIEAIEEAIRPVSTKFRLRGLESDSSINSDRRPFNLGEKFRWLVKHLPSQHREGDRSFTRSGSKGRVGRGSELPEPISRCRSCVTQDKLMQEVVQDLKEFLPPGSMNRLDEFLDYPRSDEGKRTQPKGENNHPNEPEYLYIGEGPKKLKVKKGLSTEEEKDLLHLLVDCGGIMKTIMSTHDINLKSNLFLKDFFGLAGEFKKECHDISNLLVSLSSKIKSIP